MQSHVPELTNISKETDVTRAMYGVGQQPTHEYGTKCLLARRLVERGVRFIQIYSGGLLNGDDWDGHGEHARDLGGDFGRTPITDGQLRDGGGYRGGRDHNPYGFSMWMAGGGIRGGKIIGATDEIGFRATEDPVHANDIHATILGLLGMDHKRLTYFFQGAISG